MWLKGDLVKMIRTVADINHDMTSANAFFNFSGHTEGVGISIYPLGWEHDSKFYFVWNGYNDKDGMNLKMTVKAGNVVPMECEIHYDTIDEMLKAIREVGKEGT